VPIIFTVKLYLLVSPAAVSPFINKGPQLLIIPPDFWREIASSLPTKRFLNSVDGLQRCISRDLKTTTPKTPRRGSGERAALPRPE
jgi:hypothetical protein